MVELRKRKAAEAPAAPPLAKRPSSVKSSKGKAVATEKPKAPANGASSCSKVTIGDAIDLHDFGGEVETNEGEKTTLKKLVEDSKSGVVLFTYPKASTPGCTTQACLFRDEYKSLTGTGFSIYGLSTDSTKSNTTFKTKQHLPYTLLCDHSATLIAAIGMKKAPKGTTRGVFVVSKDGKILAAEAGGPAATVEIVRKLVGGENATANRNDGAAKMDLEVDDDKANGQKTEEAAVANGDEAKANVAAEVADSAQKLDESVEA